MRLFHHRRQQRQLPLHHAPLGLFLCSHLERDELLHTQPAKLTTLALSGLRQLRDVNDRACRTAEALDEIDRGAHELRIGSVTQDGRHDSAESAQTFRSAHNRDAARMSHNELPAVSRAQ